MFLDVWAPHASETYVCCLTYYSNVPAGVLVIGLVSWIVPTRLSSNEENSNLPLSTKLYRLDIPGLILFLGAICCLLLVLTWGGQQYAWNDPKIIALFIVFGLLTIAFCYWLVRQGDAALIPIGVLKNRSIYMGSIVLIGFGLVSVVVGDFSLCKILDDTNVLPVWLLSSDLVPVCARGLYNRERSPLYCTCWFPDRVRHHCRWHSDPMGILCKF